MNKFDNVYFSEQDRTHHERISTLNTSSPWPDADVSFLYTNMDYPFLHTHQYWEFLFLVQGQLDNQVNGQSFIMKANDGCLVRPQDNHKLISTSSEPVIILNFMAKLEYIDNFFRMFGQDISQHIMDAPSLQIEVDNPLANRIVSETLQLQSSQLLTVEEKVVRCKILFAELFLRLMQQRILSNVQRPDWLSNLLVKLATSPCSNETIKKQIANYTQYSYPRLAVLFKEYMGCTIWEYTNTKRMERATEFLKHTNLKIIEIANQLGYEEIATFNHSFKRYYGITPTQYRKQYHTLVLKPAKAITEDFETK